MSRRPSVLVLGAGIQGICAALALRARGYTVTMLDRMPDLMLRTSLRNEGKIHLGFVYANDASFQTASLLLRAALQFAPLFDEWLGTPLPWRALTSTPFTYLIMRDSMLAPDQIRAHYAQLQACLPDIIAETGSANYLGHDLRNKSVWQPAPNDAAKWFASDHVAECIETVELAINREKFRAVLKTRLAAFPEITMRFGRTIKTIARTPNGFHVSGTTADGAAWSESAEIVVNCLWDGRLALDAQMGLISTRSFVMRLKYRVLGELAPALRALPSLTMVLGRYGDIVQYPDAPTYFSWYPACLRGWSADLTPPRAWDAACAGNPPPEIAAKVVRETLDAFEEIVPGVGNSRAQTVDGGVIYAWGETDIDDYNSALHRRHEIGVSAHDGYYSIDTGKFTCAPLFAQQLAEHVAHQTFEVEANTVRNETLEV